MPAATATLDDATTLLDALREAERLASEPRDPEGWDMLDVTRGDEVDARLMRARRAANDALRAGDPARVAREYLRPGEDTSQLARALLRPQPAAGERDSLLRLAAAHLDTGRAWTSGQRTGRARGPSPRLPARLPRDLRAELACVLAALVPARSLERAIERVSSASGEDLATAARSHGWIAARLARAGIASPATVARALKLPRT